ncbi:MAG: cyclohexanone monooxygenase, partial [Actinomycetia bacterium]|nr:cyclohexanone monooxygenase [Actinomycetes bacterium]
MTHHRVVVVGAGFAGMGASIALARAGIEHVVIERADDVGGTWRDNRYPGCRCDVPSHLYSFSFAPNPEWSETYSPQPEIQAYLRRTAERYGVTARTRFGHGLHEATWDGAAQ